MLGRDDLYRRFAERFHAGKRVRPATEAQLQAAESALAVLLPESYRRFALTCGALYTPSLLDLVVARKPGYSDVQQFLTPRQAVTETRDSGLEPPGTCFVLATDCSGNLFVFRDLPASPPRPDDAPVWLFDHEEDAMSIEAASFEAWLTRFLEL